MGLGTTSKAQKGSGRFLWEVKGGLGKVYLSGTVHMVPEKVFPLKLELIETFDQCNNFVCEVVISDEMIHGSKLTKITDDIIENKEYIYEDGDSLYNHFDKAKVMRLRNYLVKYKMCSEKIGKKFYKLKPSVVKVIIYFGLLKRAGLDGSAMGIDHFFTKRAMSMNKNLIALETLEFQEELLNEYYKNDKKVSAEELKNRAEAKKNRPTRFNDTTLKFLDFNWFNRQIQFKLMPWLDGITVKLCGYLYTEAEDKVIKDISPKSKALLGDRNIKMVEKIQTFLRTNDSYFVVVGAAHLLAKDNIIELLQKKGYIVERIL